MALDPTSRNRSDSFDVTWEELAGWTPEQMQEFIANLSDEERADFQTNFNADAHDDIEAGDDSIEELIKRIRRETRRESAEKKAEGEALIALLEQSISVESERIEGVRDAVSDAFTTYNATHVDSTGQHAEIYMDELENKEMEWQMGGWQANEEGYDPFAVEHEEITARQDAINGGYINNQDELINGHTAEELQAFFEERELQQLRELQQIRLHLGPNDTVWTEYDEATRTLTVHVRRDGDSQFTLTFLDAEEAIVVYDGGRLVDRPSQTPTSAPRTGSPGATKANLQLNTNFSNTKLVKNVVLDPIEFTNVFYSAPLFNLVKQDDIPNWDEHSMSHSYRPGNADSLWDQAHPEDNSGSGASGTGTPGSTTPTTDYRPEGYQDTLGALDRAVEIIGGDAPSAGQREAWERAVDEIYTFLEEHADGSGGYEFTADEARELWESIVGSWPDNDETRASRVTRFVVALFMEMDRSLFGRLCRPFISQFEEIFGAAFQLIDDDDVSMQEARYKLALIILEHYAGPGEYPVAELLTHTDADGRLVRGLSLNPEENIQALDRLEQILQQDGQELPANLQTARENEQTIRQVTNQNGGYEPLGEWFTDDDRRQVMDWIDEDMEDNNTILEDDGTDGEGHMRANLEDFFQKLNELRCETLEDMRQFISGWLNSHLNGDSEQDDLVGAMVYLLDRYASNLLKELIRDRVWAGEIRDYLGGTGSDQPGEEGFTYETAVEALGFDA